MDRRGIRCWRVAEWDSVAVDERSSGGRNHRSNGQRRGADRAIRPYGAMEDCHRRKTWSGQRITAAALAFQWSSLQFLLLNQSGKGIGRSAPSALACPVFRQVLRGRILALLHERND